jgi:DNA topoisomerase-1
MSKQLIIVESPAKARTISKFLGSNYEVFASMGHVRDLPSRKLGFDPETNFSPEYEVSKDKEKVIKEIRKQLKKDTEVLLATDEDREGESISWHLIQALELDQSRVRRIVFHEITKSAILRALESPREVDQRLVDAQQARRLLDRAVGYELSPLLWKKVRPGLSAGRVQSVAVRIVVDREKEIRKFVPEEYWKITSFFDGFSAELSKWNGKTAKVGNAEDAQTVIESLKAGSFTVKSVEERDSFRKPSAPFTTSTLQQEASTRLGYSVKRTMTLAQQLYEGNFEIPGYSGGLITYMRTDSVTLAQEAVTQLRQLIPEKFGAEFLPESPRQFRNRAKNAQEAHEAIRPVDPSQTPEMLQPHLGNDLYRLYELIWRRAVASQMEAARFARTIIRIEAGSGQEFLLEAKGQRILFPGFLSVQVRAGEDAAEVLGEKDVTLPKVEQGQRLQLAKAPEEKQNPHPEQLFTKPPARYTEATLVKKLESEGIGRPSTYAPTISIIQDRKYVEKTQDGKLRPTDMGEVVNEFLIQHFAEIVNLGFTAKMERNFDRIAHGEEDWIGTLGEFYFPFHQRVEEKEQSVTRAEAMQARVLGTDPDSGRDVSVRIGKFGPMVQIGTKDDEEKPRFASLPEGKSMQEITLEEALGCFALPRALGEDASGNEIVIGRGRFGPYVKSGKDYHSLPKGEDPFSIDLERALELVRAGEEAKAKKVIHDFGELQVLRGPYGPYIKFNKKNYKIPKGVEAETLDEPMCRKIIEEAPPPGTKKRFTRKRAAKES